MFVWRPSVILSEIDRLVPDLSTGLQELRRTWAKTSNLKDAMREVYPNLKKISIDFAVMEQAKRVVMLESDFDWDDVGEWPAIARHYPADENGNVFKGSGVAIDASNNSNLCRARALCHLARCRGFNCCPIGGCHHGMPQGLCPESQSACPGSIGETSKAFLIFLGAKLSWG